MNFFEIDQEAVRKIVDEFRYYEFYDNDGKKGYL